MLQIYLIIFLFWLNVVRTHLFDVFSKEKDNRRQFIFLFSICFCHNLIHLMGNRLLDRDWTVYLKPFIISLWGENVYTSIMFDFYCETFRCPMMLRVVRKTFWTPANGRALASTWSRSRPSPPSSSAAWRSSSRSWTRRVEHPDTSASNAQLLD